MITMFKELFFISALIVFCGSTNLNLNNFGFKTFLTIESSCYTIQEEERLFTGQCHFEIYEVSKNIDKVKDYILKQSDALTIENLLKNGFIDSTSYFQETYKEYQAQYDGLFYLLIYYMNKIYRHNH